MSEIDPEKRKEEKKNTDAWKLKQEEKKRKKEAEAQNQNDSSEKQNKKDKKQKKKEEKKESKQEEKIEEKKQETIKTEEDLAKQQKKQKIKSQKKQLNTDEMKGQGLIQTDLPVKVDKVQKKEKKKEDKKDSKKQQQCEQSKTDKKDAKNERKLSEKQLQSSQPLPPPPIVYRKLQKISNLLTTKERESQNLQEQLVSKYMDQCISKNDVILYVGESVKKFSCQQVYCQGINKSTQAELVCRYPDLSYFLEGSVTKIFIEAQYIFANGSILAKEGALNIALMGTYYNIPVVAVGGSWCFNGWSPIGFNALLERYGTGLNGLDWIEQKHIKSLIIEVGILNPRQISGYPGIVYKNLNLQNIEW